MTDKSTALKEQLRTENRLIEYLNERQREPVGVPTYSPNFFARDPFLEPSPWRRWLSAAGRALGISRRAA